MGKTARRLSVVLGVVPALALLGVPQPAHAASILVVDDDLACAGATQSTIQAAVNAAAAGDTIKVCAGSYPETVVVNKTLTFLGAKAGVDARTRANTGESAVKGTGGGFDVQANDVVIDGFTVENATNAPGIYLHAANNGSRVRNNIIQNNTFGVYANSSGPGITKLNQNRFIANNVAGSAAGNAVYSDQGLSGGRIKRNLMEGHENAGVLIALTAPTVNDVVVKKNTSVDNSSFIAAFHGTNLKVDQNTTSDTIPGDNGSQGSAIFIGGNSSAVTVTTNIVKKSPFNGVAIRMTAAAVVQGNTIKKSANDGISVTSSNAGGVSVVSNVVTSSQQGGISLSDTTSGDSITGNTSTGNNLSASGAVDCIDVTLGGGTAGTDNTWTGNTGNTSSPVGLC